MSDLPAAAGDHIRASDAARTRDAVGTSDATDAPRHTSRYFRLAGPGGVDIVPASEIELPAFHLDRRTHADTPRESLRRFDPERAGLPETTLDEAPGYIRDNLTERPWLRSAEHAPPEVQRVFVALDKGRGHAAERHEGEVTAQELRDRVTRLEDPAQLDPGQRARSEDAYRRGRHFCGSESTQIWDPDAFATAFVRAVEHPDVRAVLDRTDVSRRRPNPVEPDISDLLGPDGHRFCSGYRLVAQNGDVRAAMGERAEWAQARREGRPVPVPEPACVPIEDFKGGKIKIVFTPKADRSGYEVLTMHPDPPQRESEG